MIDAHLFDTEQEAMAALAIIDAGEGLPVNPAAATTGYTTCLPYTHGWYIRADETTIRYLGEAEQFDPPVPQTI